MKQTISFVLAFVLILCLVGCDKKQVADNPPANDTQPTNIVIDEPQDIETKQPTEQTQEETAPAEVVTEPQELDPYEEYISSVEKGEYRYVDLDADGEQELFISRDNSKCEIVTIIYGEPVSILTANDLFLCDGGIIGRYSEGAGGQTVIYYRVDNHAAVIADAIMTLNDGTWYHGAVESILHVSEQNMNRITKEEAQKKVNEQYVLLEDGIPWFLTWLYGEQE